MNFKTLLPLFLLSFHWSLTNKEANFLSHLYRKDIFIQTRRLWRVHNQPIEPFVIVSHVKRILQLIKKHAFLWAMLEKNLLMLLAVRISSYGCTWEVWRVLKKLELHSAIASCNSYASFVLSKLPACIHNSIYAR